MLYVVGTPIGHLDDITLRALSVLKSADLIAAEDTRHSGILLRHFEIRKPLISYHEHNEARRTAELVERLAAGETIALITDARHARPLRPGSKIDSAHASRRALPFTIVPGVSGHHYRTRRLRLQSRPILLPRFSCRSKAGGVPAS